MNYVLWGLQGLLAFAMFAAAMMKLTTPREKLITKQPWAADFNEGQIKMIGLVELLGAVGLIVPWVTGILRFLTPLAALGLVAVMGGAAKTHLRRKENAVPAIVLGVIALVVALGRSGYLPY